MFKVRMGLTKITHFFPGNYEFCKKTKNKIIRTLWKTRMENGKKWKTNRKLLQCFQRLA